MFHRTVKKFVGGKWEPIKWQGIQVGDKIRIYEKGMLAEDLVIEVKEVPTKFEQNYWQVVTDKGVLYSKGILSPQRGLRNPNKVKHRQRKKSVLK